MGRRGTRLGYRAHDVGVNGRFTSQLAAALQPYRVHHLSFEDGVRTREIDIFKNAERITSHLGALDDIDGVYTVTGKLNDFAGLYLAYVASAN